MEDFLFICSLVLIYVFAAFSGCVEERKKWCHHTHKKYRDIRHCELTPDWEKK